MYFKKLSVALCGIVLMVASCKKDDATPAVSTRIKTYTEESTSSGSGHTSYTLNLSYDDNNRLVSAVDASSPGDKFVYNYVSSSLYTMDIYNANVINIHTNYYLNSSSLVDSTMQYNDTHDTTTEKYIYNAARQLVTLKSYSYSSTTGAVLEDMHTYQYDANGNQVSDSDGSTVINYDYTTLANPLGFLTPYLPANHNLVQKVTGMLNGTPYTVNQTYTFDSNNRLITQKAVDTSTGDVRSNTFTY